MGDGVDGITLTLVFFKKTFFVCFQYIWDEMGYTWSFKDSKKSRHL